jgi:hypothetical protein
MVLRSSNWVYSVLFLPIWHKISKNEALSYRPTIADLAALNTSNFTIEELAKEICKAVGK